MVCISCDNEHMENFCPNCGERAGIQRITLQSVFNEVFYSFTSMDKGIFYNLKYLTLNPKQLITEYIKGKRKGIYNPLTFLIIATTIYVILDGLIDIPTKEVIIETTDESKKSRIYLAGVEAGHLIRDYLKYFWVLTVFWLSTSTRLLFGKYNLIEHISINSFVLGFATLAGTLGVFFFNLPLPFNPIVYIIILITIYRIFEVKKDKFSTVIQTVFSLLFFIVQVYLTLFIIGFLRT